MRSTCLSSFAPYAAVGTNAVATVSTEAYTCVGTVSPLPLPVTVFVNNQVPSQFSSTYDISIGPTGASVNYSVVLSTTEGQDFVVGEIVQSTIPTGVNVIFPNGSSPLAGFQPTLCAGQRDLPLAAITQVTLNMPGTLTPTSFVSGDIYTINMLACDNVDSFNVQVNLSRSNIKKFAVPQVASTCFDCNCLTQGKCGNVRVPIISIAGQTTIDGSDVGDVKFTICDEFTYYKEEKLCHDNVCAVIFIAPSQIKQTVFNQCCPFMVSVLKGRGFTLREKAQSLFDAFSSKIGVPFETFYDNIILYGMSKYILSRLLYGHFNINFLLGKYNEKFLKNLGDSRFCSFLQVFVDCNLPLFGYNVYFKSGKHMKHHKQISM